MRILALETSTNRGSVALLEGTTVVAHESLLQDQRTAQSFAPAMSQLLVQSGWEPKSIRLVATTNGPGSFTGLRIAVTAAKTFAYVVDANLVALNTLDVLVHQLPNDVCRACALMDAQRGQLFFAVYERTLGKRWNRTHDCQIVDRDQLTGHLAPGTVLTGPATEKILEPLPNDLSRADPACWDPRAATVGQLAWHALEAGQRDDPLKLTPCYFRPSYAEEKARNRR